MPRIRCHYVDCVYLDEGHCGAPSVELDPDEGCLTFTRVGADVEEEEWENDEDLLDDGWEDVEFEDEEDDFWLEEDDDD